MAQRISWKAVSFGEIANLEVISWSKGRSITQIDSVFKAVRIRKKMRIMMPRELKINDVMYGPKNQSFG
jgi:hypothetical protein